MIACNYTTHLYCDCGDCRSNPEFAEFIGRSRAETFRQARKMGWRINKDATLAYAPGHRKSRRIFVGEPYIESATRKDGGRR